MNDNRRSSLWIHCPICGGKTRTKVYEDTVLVKSGRLNKRKHELYELAVNETEAAAVRIMFDKYVLEGFGAQRLATYLNNLGYWARTGKMWHHASIRGIICNLTYGRTPQRRKRIFAGFTWLSNF